MEWLDNVGALEMRLDLIDWAWSGFPGLILDENGLHLCNEI